MSSSAIGSIFQSRGARVFILAILALLMVIPITMVNMVVWERSTYQKQATLEVGQSWGGPVSLGGPALVIPREARWVETSTDENGVESHTDMVTDRPALVLLPEQLDAGVQMNSEIRHRGIFEVPVYNADISLSFVFDTDRLLPHLGERDVILWGRTSLTLLMPQTRRFTGEAVLMAGATQFDLEPGVPIGQQSGIQAALGDPRNLGDMTLRMGLNGAQNFSMSPVARQTTLKVTSDWPHPSFTGNFLPDDYNVSDAGFSATWDIPHIARDIPQISETLSSPRQTNIELRLFNPVNFYQKVGRATKYGGLFIALTFLTVFLMEGMATKRIHPAQFILIGAAQSIFFLLLLAFSEQVGFALSYLGATGATIALLGYYGASGLGLGRRSLVLVAVLLVLYLVLFVLLQSTDYALLIGSLLAFIAVAAAMVFTRHESWYSGPNDRSKQ